MPTLGSIGEKVDLLIKQGATFGQHILELTDPLTNQPLNLLGASLRGTMRKEFGGPVVATFATPILDAAGGKAGLSLDAITTAALTCGPTIKDPASQYVWDLEMTDTLARVIPIMYGDVKVFRDV